MDLTGTASQLAFALSVGAGMWLTYGALVLAWRRWGAEVSDRGTRIAVRGLGAVLIGLGLYYGARELL